MSSPERYHIELHFSPGAYTSSDKSVVNPVSSGYRTSYPVRQVRSISTHNISRILTIVYLRTLFSQDFIALIS